MKPNLIEMIENAIEDYNKNNGRRSGPEDVVLAQVIHTYVFEYINTEFGDYMAKTMPRDHCVIDLWDIILRR